MNELVLCHIETPTAMDQAKALLATCREYALGLKIELHRKADVKDLTRSLELATLFCHCKLQSSHLQLALRSAMTTAYNMKNYVSASSFAKRLLDLHPPQTLADQARQVARFC